MTQFGPPIGQDDPPPKPSGRHDMVPGFASRGLGLAVILIAAVAGAAAYRLLSSPAGGPARAQVIEARESAPAFVKEGARITVPQGSPLRGKLVIEAVATKDIQRSM